MPSFPIVDSHVHLYDPGLLSYSWMAEHPRLQRPHLMPDFDRARGPVEVDRLVFVEVDVDRGLNLQEAAWAAGQVAAEPRIAAIVAAAGLERGAAARDELERLAGHPRLRGIRRLIQSEPDPEFCLRPAFVEGVRLLAEYGLSFDLCIRHHQLANATRLVQSCPQVQFVLDHIAKPDIRNGLVEPWRTELRALAALPNVVCKISGVVTEADHARWSREQLRPYVEHAVDCFGFRRVMFGGDWPVLDLAAGYGAWVAILDWIVEDCSQDEKRALFCDTAVTTYRL
jgi:L-fuconolactonase